MRDPYRHTCHQRAGRVFGTPPLRPTTDSQYNCGTEGSKFRILTLFIQPSPEPGLSRGAQHTPLHHTSAHVSSSRVPMRHACTAPPTALPTVKRCSSSPAAIWSVRLLLLNKEKQRPLLPQECNCLAASACFQEMSSPPGSLPTQQLHVVGLCGESISVQWRRDDTVSSVKEKAYTAASNTMLSHGIQSFVQGIELEQLSLVYEVHGGSKELDDEAVLLDVLRSSCRSEVFICASAQFFRPDIRAARLRFCFS
jgi:hypothetical protein